MSWRRLAGGGALLALLTVAGPARADGGDVRVGAALSWQVPQTGRIGGVGELGLSDFAAVHAEVDAALGPLGWQGLLAMGPTFFWDVATWVPAITLAGGIATLERTWAPRVLLRGEMRRYLAAHTALGLGIAAEGLVRQGVQVQMVLQVNVMQEL